MDLRLPLAALVVAACNGDSPGAADAEPADAVSSPDATAVCEPLDPPAADCADPCFEDRDPALLMDIDVAELDLAAPVAGSLPVRVALFYTVAPQESTAWTREDAITRMKTIVEATNPILAQCNMHVELEAAQVVALPARLLDITGNEKGSFGGHPPEGTPNPDLFDYEQNERLTDESLELFQFGKMHSSKNAISAFTVRYITYYSNQMLSSAGGLSYPPNIYHHVDDYPYRNSVLLVPGYGACGDLPGLPGTRTLAHEIGHMLLNTGGHSTLAGNLMSNGSTLTPEQCQVMETNLSALFGEAEVPDPGPPPTMP